jgi:hypothetical protein
LRAPRFHISSSPGVRNPRFHVRPPRGEDPPFHVSLPGVGASPQPLRVLPPQRTPLLPSPFTGSKFEFFYDLNYCRVIKYKMI